MAALVRPLTQNVANCAAIENMTKKELKQIELAGYKAAANIVNNFPPEEQDYCLPIQNLTKEEKEYLPKRPLFDNLNNEIKVIIESDWLKINRGTGTCRCEIAFPIKTNQEISKSIPKFANKLKSALLGELWRGDEIIKLCQK